MKRRQSPHTFLLHSRLAAVGLLASAILFAGSVNAELRSERYSAADILSDAHGLFSDTQCHQENRISYLLQLVNHSGSGVISFLRSGWSSNNGQPPATGSSSQAAQPESIAFAALFLLTLSLIFRRGQTRYRGRL